MRYVSKTLYHVIKMDNRTTCPLGHRVTMLHARCLTKLPQFYICFTCGFIGEIGVGVVREGKTP